MKWLAPFWKARDRKIILNENNMDGKQYIYIKMWQVGSATKVLKLISYGLYPWWCHQMETSSALLALCVGNSPVTGEFPTQRPVTRSFDVFCDLRLNKRLSKQLWGWWFETPSRSLWRHCYAFSLIANHPESLRASAKAAMSLGHGYVNTSSM